MAKESVQMRQGMKKQRDQRGRGEAGVEREHAKDNCFKKTKLKSDKSEEIMQEKIYSP